MKVVKYEHKLNSLKNWNFRNVMGNLGTCTKNIKKQIQGLQLMQKPKKKYF